MMKPPALDAQWRPPGGWRKGCSGASSPHPPRPHWLQEYNQCVIRVRSRTDGKGNCQGQYEELAMCQDHCIGKDLFNYVK